MTFYRILQINSPFDSCSTDLTNLVERADNDHTAGKDQQGEEELRRCDERGKQVDHWPFSMHFSHTLLFITKQIPLQ